MYFTLQFGTYLSFFCILFIPTMGSSVSTSSFYETFVPRTVDKRDLGEHCDEMIQELEPEECTCHEIRLGPCDLPLEPDDYGYEGDCEEEECKVEESVNANANVNEFRVGCCKEDLRKDAFHACVQARIAIGTNQEGMAEQYHNCWDLYRTWKHLYEC